MNPAVRIWVEDPGAANFLAALPEDLAARGTTATLSAGGAAIDYLARRGIPFDPAPQGWEALLTPPPRLVLVGTSENPDAMGLALLDAARSRGIRTAAAVDAAMNADWRFRGRSDRPLAHAPDQLFITDDSTAESFAALGFPRRAIRVVGHPHYDVVRARREVLEREGKAAVRARRFSQAPSNRRVVVFIAEVLGGLNETQFRSSSEYTLTGTGGSRWRSEIAVEEYLAAAASLTAPPFSVLRLPPQADDVLLATFRNRFDAVSREDPIEELLFGADLVVGMTSMPLVEAALLGRPTLAILCRPQEREWLPTIATGETVAATTSAQARDALARLLAVTEPNSRTDRLPSGGRAALAEAVALLVA